MVEQMIDPTALVSLRHAVADPSQVKSRAIDVHAAAHDASHMLMIPQAVVIARDAEEVGRLMLATSTAGLPLVLRSGGTSLSGQSVTDGVLVDVRRHFREFEVLDAGTRVIAQPGLTVRALNARLAAHGRAFGPDPASEVACTIGGVVANNSSGMACGTTNNAYRTLESLTLVLPSGTVLDTGTPDADERLAELEPDLYAGLLRLRDQVRGNPESVDILRRQFAMKNTMGYGLNSFLDYDRAIDIAAHLAVGSEGTLGFIAEAVFATIEVQPHAATALLIFDDLAAAMGSLTDLVATGAATIELMDAVSLRVGQRGPDVPAQVRDLAVQEHSALLVEYRGATVHELEQHRNDAQAVVDALPLSVPAYLSDDPASRADLWHLRKGLYAAVAGARLSGTTALLEDVVVPVEALARTCTQLTELFGHYGYRDSVIFGHAKDGNIHFMLVDDFTEPEAITRYAAFTDDLVDLVLGEGGSLKAEHGTGRVMAPYVRRQYGDELYSVMRDVKALFDPHNTLNPGTILDEDPQAHLRHLKSAPTVEPEVDRCVECGYCEPVCPSRDLTLTPRQRIVVHRAIAEAEAGGDVALAAELRRDEEYASVQTCAVDGMCATTCPVLINTGDLVKKLRARDVGAAESKVWGVAAKRWGTTTKAAGTALSATRALPPPLVELPNRLARRLLGEDTVPMWSPELPGGGAARARPALTVEPDAVYLPACVSTMFGPTDGSPGVQVSFEALCQRAGLTLLVPEGVDALCCGTPWSSKGLADAAKAMRDTVLTVLLQATDGGRLPVVCDASSCTEGLLEAIRNGGAWAAQLTVLDAVDFAAHHIVPVLPEVPLDRRVPVTAVHPTCSSTRLGSNASLVTVTRAFSQEAVVAADWGCCAFAGDRGMLHPELTESATAVQAAQVRELDADIHVSCNRTCELGMTRATGAPYRHVVEALEAACALSDPEPRPNGPRRSGVGRA